MPLLDAVVGDTVQYRNADGETSNVIVLGVQPEAPDSAPDVDDDDTGGTLEAGTYSYRITRIVNGAESEASAAGTVVVASGSTNVTIVTLPGEDGVQYGIYGRSAGTEEFMVVTAAGADSFIDTGEITPDGPLAEDIEEDGRVALRSFHTGDINVLGVPPAAPVVKATAMHGNGSTGVYFKR